MVSLKAAQVRVRRRVKRAATLVRRAAPFYAGLSDSLNTHGSVHLK